MQNQGRREASWQVPSFYKPTKGCKTDFWKRPSGGRKPTANESLSVVLHGFGSPPFLIIAA